MKDNDRPCVAETLIAKRLCIDTHLETVAYIRRDSPICRAEGFQVHVRVKVQAATKSILATLNMVDDSLLQPGELGLSEYAWQLLEVQSGERVTLAHQEPLESLASLRAKIYGHELNQAELDTIIADITRGTYSDIHIASFLTACAGGRLTQQEVVSLTQAMVKVGERLQWPADLVVDKHCIGGLPGNRTTLIVVPIVAAYGLMIPKSSSRAITSPAGTADTMEVLAPVDIDFATMRRVVEQENGCIVWGRNIDLSPADDVLITVERAMDIDSSGQLVASVLSKKISAGSSHIVIDIPTGESAKVRTAAMADQLKKLFQAVAKASNLEVKFCFSDGRQPVGYGIGPCLEAQDVLSVLQNEFTAPMDLRQRALSLAGSIIEFSPTVHEG